MYTKYLSLLLALSWAAVYAQKDCDKSDKSKCNWSLYSHYEGKGCEPVYDKDCCPIRFDCSKFQTNPDKSKCIYKGKGYITGESINTTNPCQKCTCGPKGAISCAVIDCFQERLEGTCLPLFEHSSCCPVSFKCIEGRADEEKGVTCRNDGRTYFEGQLIDMPDDPCTKCICKSDWKDKKSPSCQRIECNFPANNQRLRDGCIPIYFEGQCCPVDWLCPPPDAPAARPAADVNSCTFAGRTVDLGKILEHPDPCIACSCSTPPDLTCVRRRCSLPEDFEKCRPLPPKEGQCCPQYECRRQ